MKALNAIVGALVVVSAAGFSSPTQAALAYRTTLNHGSVACAGVAPKYEDMLKSRPQGRRNDAAAGTAVMQCGGVATPANQEGDVIVYEVGLNNLGANDIVIKCSVADGLHSVVTMYPKKVTVPAGGTAFIEWNGNDTGGTTWDNGARFGTPALSCQLPPQGEIDYTAIIYQVDVGN